VDTGLAITQQKRDSRLKMELKRCIKTERHWKKEVLHGS